MFKERTKSEKRFQGLEKETYFQKALKRIKSDILIKRWVLASLDLDCDG